LIHLPEPTLLFGHSQSIEDPRDGLSLFGPFDPAQTYGVRYGVIGTKDGIRRFAEWVERIQHPIVENPPTRLRPPFPGFEVAFGIPFSPKPLVKVEFQMSDLNKHVHIGDRFKRTYETAGFFTDRISEALRTEEERPDIWFIIAPEDVYKYCRPKSFVEKEQRIEAEGSMRPTEAIRLVREPSFFQEWNEAAVPYQYDPDFRNQIKGRLLSQQILTQVIRESTLAHREFLNKAGKPTRQLDKLQSEIAWNLGSAIYYKVGGRPWKLNGVRKGVCYVGLAFKRDERNPNPQAACCAAQMFLDSGDGVVFKGNVGPWMTGKRGHFHLTTHAAYELLNQAIESYKSKHDRNSPDELFVHGKIRFQEPEWNGFLEAAGTRTNVVGVKIDDADDFRLYREQGSMPVMRNIAWLQNERSGYLWSRGFIPRLQTYPGKEVPRPLFVEICEGKASIETVLQDVVGLTKLNYNSCRFADGVPVTLKFADAVGEVLISGPAVPKAPLPFRHYI
ncbi:MAG: hypothetical protein L0Z50_20280, partial [Verrucomicrobiales bacterium]|nr:hypothetical protein [Verrucomicrobiales bacterium]